MRAARRWKTSARAVVIPDVAPGLVLRAADYLEGLVREFTLLRLDAEHSVHSQDTDSRPVPSPPAASAPVHRAQVLTEIHRLVMQAAVPREQARTQAEAAIAADRARCTLQLDVSPELAASLPRAVILLDQAARLAREGGLLTLPPDPEVESFWRAGLQWLNAVVSEADAGVAGPRRGRTFGARTAARARRAHAGATLGAVHLPCESDTPARARRWLAARLAEAGQPDIVDEATLPLTELVTNAVLHAGTPVTVVATIQPGGLRVEVHDGVARPPVSHHRQIDALTGRGLDLVTATTRRWGVTPQRTGKAVWFEVASPHEPAEGDSAVSS